MAQCEATSSTPGRASFGQRCSRPAVSGSTFCSSHDGVKFSSDTSKVRRRKEKPAVKCTALKRNGEPCGRFALRGATVCTSHGANLPSVRGSAREKLLELVLPAISELEAVLSNQTTANSDKLRAIQLILDRTGYGTKSEMEVTVKPWEQTLKGIMRTAPARADQFVLESSAVASDFEDNEEDPIDAEFRQVVLPRTVGSNTPPVHPDLRRRSEHDR